MRSGRNVIPAAIGLAGTMLVLGVAIGSFAFPTIKTETRSNSSRVTVTQTLVNEIFDTKTETSTELSTVTTSHPTAYLVQSISASGLSGNSTNEELGVRLHLSINTSSVLVNAMGYESGLLVGISDSNILSSANNLSASSEMPIQRPTLGTCITNYPFGISVFRGYFDSGNVSRANSIYLFPTASCPIGEAPPTFYIFGPQTTLATLLSTSYYISNSPYFSTATTHESYPSRPMAYNIPLIGSCPCTISGTRFTPFASGSYTIAGADEWGNLLVLHFSVMR